MCWYQYCTFRSPLIYLVQNIPPPPYIVMSFCSAFSFPASGTSTQEGAVKASIVGICVCYLSLFSTPAGSSMPVTSLPAQPVASRSSVKNTWICTRSRTKVRLPHHSALLSSLSLPSSAKGPERKRECGVLFCRNSPHTL